MMLKSCAGSAALLLLLPAISQAEQDFAAFIPGDAHAVVWVQDVTAFTESVQASPFGKLWEDDAMGEIREWASTQYADMVTDAAEKDVNLDKLCEAVTGGAALWFGTQGSPDDWYLSAVLATDEEGRQTLIDMFNQEPEGEGVTETRSSFDAAGTTVYKMVRMEEGTEKPDSFMYAAVGDLLTVGLNTTEDTFKATLSGVSNGRHPSSFADTDRVKRHASGWSTPSRFNAFGDIAGVMKLMMARDEVDTEAMANIATTGAMDLEALLLTSDISAKGIESTMIIGMGAEKRGLVKALYASEDVTLDLARATPGDALSFTAWTLDLGAVINAIIAIADTFQPGVTSMLPMYTAPIKSQYGVDPLEDVLKNISGEHSYYARELSDELKRLLGDDPMAALVKGEVYTLGLRNGDQTSASLKTLVTNLSQDPSYGGFIEVSDVDGATLVKLNMPGMDQSAIAYSFAFNSNNLMIANNHTDMAQALRFAAGGATGSLAEKADAMALLRPYMASGLRMIQYASAESVRFSMEGARVALSALPIDQAEDLPLDSLPGGDVVTRYLGHSVSFLYFDADAWRSGSVMPAK